MVNSKEEIIREAIKEATKVLGADPLYFGEDGDKEIEKQLEKMGYSLEDFKKI